jgi:Flp pilus assembly protein TadD
VNSKSFAFVLLACLCTGVTIPLLLAKPSLSAVSDVQVIDPSLAPISAEDYLNQGVADTNRGDYQKAIANFNLAILLHPNNATAYNDRGVAYVHSGWRGTLAYFWLT